jgi:deoxyhypusine synthase
MIEDRCAILMGMSGAMVPAGMRRLVVYMLQNRLIDCLVSTGANFFHDLHETLGYYHYQGSPMTDDVALAENLIDRMYDVLADEAKFREHDQWIGQFAASLDQSRPYTTREFLYLLGCELAKTAREDGIVSAAAKARVPLFCPAVADSSIGIGVAENRHRGGNRLVFDVVGDVLEITRIVAESPDTGVIYFGGGTPKNFVQQTEVVAIIMNTGKEGHKYAVQVVTDAPHWGGLSGCTFEEAQSWGKIHKDAMMVDCHCDSTIAMPILVSGLAQHPELIRKRWKPTFTMGRELGIAPPPAV